MIHYNFVAIPSVLSLILETKLLCRFGAANRIGVASTSTPFSDAAANVDVLKYIIYSVGR